MRPLSRTVLRRSSLVAGALLAVSALIPGGAEGASAGPAAGATATAPRVAANFTSMCAFTHRAADDPIVFPGQPGAAHSHDFFANPSTDADSTVESLQAATAQCKRAGDKAAYWTPTLSDGGTAVRPMRVVAYYQVAGRDPASIQPFPLGLKVVTTPAAGGVEWSCAGRDEDAPPQATVPTCPPATHLVLRIHFPDCWDGVNLDSADHRSHLADTSRGGSCPATHPVAVPHLRLNVHYPEGVGGADVTLASGASDSAHADFFNAWDVDAQARLVRDCLNAAVSCGASKPV